VSPLDHFAAKHPLVTGVIGVASSLSGWVLDNIAQVNAVATLAGTVVGISIGLVTLALQLRKWCRNRRSRERHSRDETCAEDRYDFLDRD